ncbi:MAG: RNA methyltransferase [Defluviitaleaceae bacterium]|nr:RNA methyltransferase [Defluviitaleaceae bacterium]
MLKHLKSKKARDESGLFMVEGEKFIAEIPESYTIIRYIASRKYADTHDLAPYNTRARCEVVRDSIFKSLADTVTPQGIIAVCEKIPHTLDAILQGRGELIRYTPFILMGENLNDPGNVGTLIRTAAAAGASGAIFTQGSCDVYSPKVLRAAAGAVLRLPIITNANAADTFAALAAADVPVFAAHPRGDTLPYDTNMRDSLCLLIGNESHGISQAAQAAAHTLIRLPMTSSTESLNASVAGSILLYEAVRQRLKT